MNIVSENLSSAQHQSTVVRLELNVDDVVHILHPDRIVAFSGPSSAREDRFYNIKGMYRKKRLIQSRITGKSSCMLALPAGYFLKCIPISGDHDLLFEYRHLLFYTEGIQMKQTLQKMKHMLVTRDWIKTKFSGNGMIGILSQGPLYELALNPQQPVYVDFKSLIAHPYNADLDPCVYGNHLASQYMNFQWKITGEGYILLQTGKSDTQLDKQLQNDNLIKRILREVLPFGNIWIK